MYLKMAQVTTMGTRYGNSTKERTNERSGMSRFSSTANSVPSTAQGISVPKA